MTGQNARPGPSQIGVGFSNKQLNTRKHWTRLTSCSTRPGIFKKPQTNQGFISRHARQRASQLELFCFGPAVDAFGVGSLFQSTMSKAGQESIRRDKKLGDNRVSPVLMDEGSWAAAILPGKKCSQRSA